MDAFIEKILTIASIFVGNYGLAYYRSKQDRKETEMKMAGYLQKITERQDKIQGKDVKIWVVEDDEYDAEEVMTPILEKIGNPYQICKTKNEILSQLTNEKAVIILDDKLGPDKGIDLIDDIFRRNPGSFIILNTGSQNDQLSTDYTLLGAEVTLYKNNKNYAANFQAAVKKGILEVANFD